MKYLLILASLAIAKAGVIKNETCDIISIKDSNYEKETIRADLDRPYMLAIDRSTNTLYFSHTLHKNDSVFQTKKIELNTNTSSDLDVANGFAQTVDDYNNDAYIGSNDGIYKYDHDTNQLEFIGQKGTDIWTIFFYKDVLYYTEFPGQFLYTYINNTATRFKDLEDTKVDSFLIDNNDTMFYANATGLFSQKKGSKEAVLIESTHKEPRGINIDKNGDVFLCIHDGIYKVDKENSSLEKVFEIDDCFGIAFDKHNNFVYADWNGLYRLKPTDKTC